MAVGEDGGKGWRLWWLRAGKEVLGGEEGGCVVVVGGEDGGESWRRSGR